LHNASIAPKEKYIKGYLLKNNTVDGRKNKRKTPRGCPERIRK
jgi:hypothetical protein